MNTHFDADFVYRFGSTYHGNFTPQSDIDLAFFCTKDISETDLFFLKQDLAGQLNREIDLINLRTASTVLQVQIIGTGLLLDYKDMIAVHTFQIRTLKEYDLLNHERKPILDRIKKEKKVYGP